MSKFRLKQEFRWVVLLRRVLVFGAAILVCAGTYRPGVCAFADQPLKVGFVLEGARSDLDWSYSHDQGRIFMEKALQDKVQSSVIEQVPENAGVERVMEKMIAQGNKLIFSTAFGYLEPLLRVAARHPDVVFMQCERPAPASAKNVGSYFAIDYAPMYVAGIVAGRMTKKAKLGFIAAHPIPSIVTGINVFTMGARSANPRVKVDVVWTNSWYDPPLEAEATRGLIDSGAGVVACTNSVAVVKTCEEHGVFSVGCNVDHSDIAPKSWLTGQAWNWGPAYVQIAAAVANHSWNKANIVYPIESGCSYLASFGKSVPASVRSEARSVMKRIEKGELILFKGPIKDRNGVERVHSGQGLDAESLKKVDWVVEGVEGNLPKG